MRKLQIDEISNLERSDLFGRLELKILDFKPNILLVHTGIVFHKFPFCMMTVLRDIKSKYPYLKIGNQHDTTHIINLLKEKGLRG